MSTQKFILLDQGSATLLNTTASYEVQLAEPILLPAQAAVTISDCYIDSGLPAQGGFDIGSDIPVTMTFGYSSRLFDPTTRTPNPHMELCFLQSADTLFTKSLQFTIPAGTYSPEGLAEFITRAVVTMPVQFTGVQDTVNNLWWYPGIDNPRGNAIWFPTDPLAGEIFSMASTDNTKMLQQPATSENNGPFNMGTNQFAISYSPDGSGRYAFTFLHRPCLSASNGQPCVFLQKSPSNHYYIIPSVSNLILYNLEPKSLWQDMLGFDLQTMCITNMLDSDGNFTLEAYTACTTMAYLGVDAFNLTKSPNWNTCVAEVNWPADPDHPETILAPQVKYVQASKPPAFNSVGYYLIDLQMLPIQQNTMATNQTLNAQSLVNKTFTSEEGFAFYTSSLVQTLSTPLLVSSARVTILNASTRQPATGLGSRNSVIVKVVY